LIHKSQPNKKKIQEALRVRVEIEKGAFFIAFTKKEGVKKLMHSVKNQNHKNLAIYMAEELAEKLGDDFFKGIDLIIPVPLYPKKLKIRGFNQSHLIAKGIQNIRKTNIDCHSLQRIVFTESQTKKNRLELWKNESTTFELVNKKNLYKKCLLIIDDVFT